MLCFHRINAMMYDECSCQHKSVQMCSMSEDWLEITYFPVVETLKAHKFIASIICFCIHVLEMKMIYT